MVFFDFRGLLCILGFCAHCFDFELVELFWVLLLYSDVFRGFGHIWRFSAFFRLLVIFLIFRVFLGVLGVRVRVLGSWVVCRVRSVLLNLIKYY